MTSKRPQEPKPVDEPTERAPVGESDGARPEGAELETRLVGEAEATNGTSAPAPGFQPDEPLAIDVGADLVPPPADAFLDAPETSVPVQLLMMAETTTDTAGADHEPSAGNLATPENEERAQREEPVASDERAAVEHERTPNAAVEAPAAEAPSESPFQPASDGTALGRVDKYILAASAAVFALSIALLFADGLLTRETDIGNLAPVGRFSKSSNDVQRKVDNGLAFHPVGGTDRVFEGDSIFTGDDSEAQIDLDRGGSLVIDPKSLIVVHTRDGGLEVDLKYGSLVGKLKADKPVVILDEGRRNQLSTSNAELRITRSSAQSPTSIEILSGEVRILGGSAQGPETIKQNESATIDATGVSARRSFPITLIEPPADAQIWVRKPVAFRWEGPGEKHLFEVARDAAFSKILLSRPTEKTEVVMGKAPEDSGAFYWRVRREGDDGASSVTRRVVLHPDTAPIPVFPASGRSFMIDPSQGQKAQVIRLAWRDDVGSKEWLVQIAPDRSFQSEMVEEKTPRQSFETRPIPPGQYYWRVKGVHPDRDSAPWSEAASFTIFERERPSIAPQVETPVATYEIPPDAVRSAARFSKVESIKVGDAPVFKWAAVPDADEYLVELDKNAGFKNAQSINVGKALQYRLERVKPGVYYWRVRSISKSGKESEPSATGQVVVALPAPKPGSQGSVTQRFKSQQQSLSGTAVAKLEWGSMPFAKGYQVQWSRDENFQEVETFNSPTNSKKIIVRQEGTYYYRVRVTDGSGTPMSAFSAANTFIYRKEYPDPVSMPVAAKAKETARTPSNDDSAQTQQKAKPTATPAPATAPPKPAPAAEPKPKVGGATPPKPLKGSAPALGAENAPAPKLREPRPDTSVVAIGNSPVFVNFRWKPTKGAVKYRVEISTSPNFSNTVASGTSREPNFFMEKSLPQGKLYWRVRAELKDDVTAWSTPNSFHVSYK